MLVTRLYADSNGESHFDNIEYPLHDQGDIGFLSDRLQAEAVIFRETGTNYDYNFHTAPSRQFVVLLDGKIEIETSLGEKRQFNGGEILLLEDTTGNGHKTRTLNRAVRRSIFIVLPSIR